MEGKVVKRLEAYLDVPQASTEAYIKLAVMVADFLIKEGVLVVDHAVIGPNKCRYHAYMDLPE